MKAESALAGLEFLIVDDEEFLREIMVDLVRLEGDRAIEAESGQTAIRLLKEVNREVHVVISDVRMTDGDGIVLAKWIRTEGVNYVSCKNAPRIFLCSGFNDVSDRQRADLEIAHVFQKPVAFDEMFKIVRNSKSPSLGPAKE